jgi:hypothetical protein
MQRYLGAPQEGWLAEGGLEHVATSGEQYFAGSKRPRSLTSDKDKKGYMREVHKNFFGHLKTADARMKAAGIHKKESPSKSHPEIIVSLDILFHPERGPDNMLVAMNSEETAKLQGMGWKLCRPQPASKYLAERESDWLATVRVRCDVADVPESFVWPTWAQLSDFNNNGLFILEIVEVGCIQDKYGGELLPLQDGVHLGWNKVFFVPPLWRWHAKVRNNEALWTGDRNPPRKKEKDLLGEFLRAYLGICAFTRQNPRASTSTPVASLLEKKTKKDLMKAGRAFVQRAKETNEALNVHTVVEQVVQQELARQAAATPATAGEAHHAPISL